MTYNYRCKAGHTTVQQISIKEQTPLYIECNQCAAIAYRVYYPVPFIMRP